MDGHYLFYESNRVKFDSICLKQRSFPSYRETTYCVLSVFFADGNNADLAVISSKSWTILCVFGGFASSLSWHLAYRASGKVGLATAIFFSGATAGVRYGMICVTEEQQL